MPMKQFVAAVFGGSPATRPGGERPMPRRAFWWRLLGR
jgi:hypothetical protein